MPIRISKNRVDLENLPLIQATIKDYGEAVNALGDLAGGTDDIDLTSGNVVTATVSTATQTFTFSNPPASGTAGSFTLILTNGGSQTINWPASVIWAGGTAPTLTASGTDVLVFSTVNAGTTWQGFTIGLDMKRISIPDAPTIGIATATGATTATVTFIAPVSDGNSIILHYDAYPSSGSGTGTLTQAGSGTIDVTGLTAETTYTFTVTATNDIGEGPASSSSNEITTDPLYVDDVFSTYLYTGNGSTQTFVTGQDLDGEGGIVICKRRNGTSGHYVFSTVGGAGHAVDTSSTSADIYSGSANGVTAFTSSGHSIDNTYFGMNTSTETHVHWTFRNAPKFFEVQTVTLGAGNATALFPDLETLGMVAVKRTDSTGSWYVWHRSLTAGKLLYLEQTAAEATLGHITVSGTTVTLVDGTLADGDYVVYAWAHDTDTDTGMIQCGTFTTDGSGDATMSLGWEAQYLLYKRIDSGDHWYVFDVMRGMSYGGSQYLLPNASIAEGPIGANYIYPIANGCFFNGTNASADYIYMAIRRPNKPPTAGTEVFAPVVYTGTNTDNRLVETGIVTDLVWVRLRDNTSIAGMVAANRLRADMYIYTGLTSAESSDTDTFMTPTTGYGNSFSAMNGFGVGNDVTRKVNYDTSTDGHVALAFKRAPEFFDMVCYTGTGTAHTEAHNLGVVPEMIIVKNHTVSDPWSVYFGDETDYLWLNDDNARADHNTYWDDTAPTASVFTVGTAAGVNENGRTYMAYLFATISGISKIGSYTGNGTSQTIDCSFSAGARFILIKRTDSTGDWYVWDSVRGIVAANDPHLSLNTTAAEVTTDDSIDPDTSGFIVNQVAATNINVTSASYIYLAIA